MGSRSRYSSESEWKRVPILTNDGRVVLGSLTIHDDVVQTLTDIRNDTVYTLNRELLMKDGVCTLMSVSIGVLPVQPKEVEDGSRASAGTEASP